VPVALDALRALLPACVARGLPMLVANPDVVTVDAAALVTMPGKLAQARAYLGSFWLSSHIAVFGLPHAAGLQAAVLPQAASARNDTNPGDAEVLSWR